MAKVEDYDFPSDLWYDSREHLWVRLDGDGTTVTIGIDGMGQEALGEIVYVELAAAGRQVERGEALGSLEAEKMVRPVVAPVSGTLVDVNDAVVATPRLLNSDPYSGGWLFKIRASRWAAERAELLHGDDAVTTWARKELEANR